MGKRDTRLSMIPNTSHETNGLPNRTVIENPTLRHYGLTSGLPVTRENAILRFSNTVDKCIGDLSLIEIQTHC
jgi:hypothetical protein